MVSGWMLNRSFLFFFFFLWCAKVLNLRIPQRNGDRKMPFRCREVRSAVMGVARGKDRPPQEKRN